MLAPALQHVTADPAARTVVVACGAPSWVARWCAAELEQRLQAAGGATTDGAAGAEPGTDTWEPLLAALGAVLNVVVLQPDVAAIDTQLAEAVRALASQLDLLLPHSEPGTRTVAIIVGHILALQRHLDDAPDSPAPALWLRWQAQVGAAVAADVDAWEHLRELWLLSMPREGPSMDALAAAVAAQADGGVRAQLAATAAALSRAGLSREEERALFIFTSL